MTTITIKGTQVDILDTTESARPWATYSNPTFRFPTVFCLAAISTCTTCPAAHHTGPTCVSYFTSEFHKLPDLYPELFL